MTLSILALLCALAAGVLWREHVSRRTKRTRTAPPIKYLKRRRRLQKRLERKTGDAQTARALILAEARRLGTSPSSIEAIEAALRRFPDTSFSRL